MPTNTASIKYVRDRERYVFFPVTHERGVLDDRGVTLESKLQSLDSKSYQIAWDGSSVPDVTKIPAGVVVTYNDTEYTGTMAASSGESGTMYLVANDGNMDRYIVSDDGGSYSWVNVGSTEMDLQPIINRLAAVENVVNDYLDFKDKFVYLTQEEYETLVNTDQVDPSVYYFVAE